MTKRIAVIEENEVGRNLRFRDNVTGNIMSREEFIQKIEAGQYPHYHVRVVNGIKTPVSNPDSSENNNLG